MNNDRTTYHVTGMTCEGCARAMAHALARLLPGQEADVSHADDVIVIVGAHDTGAVEQAIAEAGFEFRGAVENRSNSGD